MKTLNTLMILIVLCFSCIRLASANDLIPGKTQQNPIALINANIYTVSGQVIKNGTLLFDKGVISSINNAKTGFPENTEIIDVKGHNVYPGLIAPYSQIGLVEIGAVRATVDYNEAGSYNPNAKAAVAYNPDSEVTPTIRSNGITTALVAPKGGIISGQSSILQLDGWNSEDATIKDIAGLHINWPRMTVSNSPRAKDSPEKQLEKIAENLNKLEDFFLDAKTYANAQKADPGLKRDIRFDAIIPVLSGDVPLIIQADEYKEIEAAVNFCNTLDMKMILLGGRDAWKLTDLLVENNISVILYQTHALPFREDEDYDLPFKTPALLKEAGVKFCITKISSDMWDIRNLPFFAGTAAAHGLSKEDALKSITLWPAEILGIDKNYGSLDKGKSATLVVSKGDILDMQSSIIEMMFIDGRKVDLDDKHKRLYKKYEARYEN
ncbi:MAG: amidohydrolase family protein [Calditrichae bacterium]|nr:amidohydrolase family protein [Calditrichota bacterium]MCB9059461.1 amidohydrolase family protein [Calditrichia bacterium]